MQKKGISLNDAHHIIKMPGVELKDLRNHIDVMPTNQAPLMVYPPDLNLIPKRFQPEERVALVRNANDPIPMPIIQELQERTSVAQVDEQTLYSVARRCALNIVHNLPMLADSYLATAITDQPFRGIPGFVVGAGPSLDRNAHLLPECAQLGIIFGVDAASGAIAAQGVESDFMVSLESKGVSHYLTHNHPGPYPRLCVDITGSPENWQVPAHKRLVTVNADPAYSDPIIALGGLPLAFGGSVALTAWSLAYWYGCDPIILIGMDLAYTGGKAYAANTKWEEQRVVRHEQQQGHFKTDLIEFVGCPDRGRDKQVTVVDAPSWGGQGTVETSHEMLTYRTWLEEVSRKCNVTIINATEGGCHCNGLLDIVLENVLDGLGKDQVECARSDFRTDEFKHGKPHHDDVRNYMLRLKENLEKIFMYVEEDRYDTKWDSNYNVRYWINQVPLLEAYLVQWAYEMKHTTKSKEVKETHAKQQDAILEGCNDMLSILNETLNKDEWR